MKLFTRMTIIINKECNQKCEWCFEGSWKNEDKKIMKLEDVEKLLKWKNWNTGEIPCIYIMGGEPTLHPKLLDIIQLIQEYDKRICIFLLTNLNCGRELLKKIVDKKVVICANVDQFEDTNNVAGSKVISENLKYLNSVSIPGFSYNITSTVSDPKKDFSFLYKILEEGKEKIYNLRLAQSSVGYELNNNFPKKHSDGYFPKILEVIRKVKEIKPNIHLSTECAVNGCMINDALYNELFDEGYKLQYECGVPEPNADILPDLSAHWCFPFERVPEMKIENVLDYPDYDAMLDELYLRCENFKKGCKPVCNITNCKNEKCKGPCPALIYYYNRLG